MNTSSGLWNSPPAASSNNAAERHFCLLLFHKTYLRNGHANGEAVPLFLPHRARAAPPGKKGGTLKIFRAAEKKLRAAENFFRAAEFFRGPTLFSIPSCLLLRHPQSDTSASPQPTCPPCPAGHYRPPHNLQNKHSALRKKYRTFVDIKQNRKSISR